MEMTIRPMTEKERAFSYTQEPEILEKAGCIGHLRGDMGADGDEFFTSWDDHEAELMTDAFKHEFGSVVNLLRSDVQFGGLLKDRNAMKAYCKGQPNSAFQENDTEYGFRADTEQYTYMIRCNPVKGEYNFYIYAYEQEKLDKALEPGQIKVLVVEPGKKPYEKEIDPGLRSLQHEVGGYIQAVYPFEEPVALIMDEEGKLKGSTLNRALRDGDRQIYDIVAGTFLVVGLSEDDFASLEEEHVKQFKEYFRTPEMFMRINGKLMVLPVEDERKEPDRPSFSDQIRGANEKKCNEPMENDSRGEDGIER